MNLKKWCWALCVALVCSCSVKEDRSFCPCWLSVYCEDVPADGVSFGVVSPERRSSRHLGEEDFTPSYSCVVPRTVQHLYACVPVPGAIVSEGRYVIPEGSQCDSLYAWSSCMDCDRETASDTLKVRKNFATLRLILSEEGDYPFDIRVCGCVCGLRLDTLEPLAGRFAFSPSVSGSSQASVRLPRQSPSDRLELELYDGDVLSGTIDLGSAILEAGYDWEEEDLKDIVVKVAASVTDIEITVNAWTLVDVYEEKI